jgi:1-acyl-sn-glycerol-3-phosphate acyltransferase
VDAPHISKPILGFFRRIVRGYFRRHFRAVRIVGAKRFIGSGADGGPLIVYANHSSWWDPMVQVLVAGKLMPERDHYAPMDASALQRYGILKRIGVFGVETRTARGAAQFLRTGLQVLDQGGVIWVTPQGRFADHRERPLEFKPGLAALASKVKGGCTVLPLAIEYTFWDERLPETLLYFGQPVQVEKDSTESVQDRLEWALVQAMDELRELALRRNPNDFETLHHGRVGTGGFYEVGQRIWAVLRRRSYQAHHTAMPERNGK